MANRWLKRASAAAAAVGLALVFGGGTAWADSPVTVNWNTTTHNGTNADGSCEHVGTSDDLNPPAGDEGWLFILTQPFDSSGSTLTYTFQSPTTTGTAPGVHMGGGGGSYHFAVYVPLGLTLVGASATNGTAGSNLVVSHCTDGAPLGPPPSSPPPPPPTDLTLSSNVTLLADNTKVIDDSSNPATALADVHDRVTVTVTGPSVWSGVLTETFYHTNNCDSATFGTAVLDVDQSTASPIDILPETGLAAGEYSYQASFALDEGVDPTTGLPIIVTKFGCEPFKVVAASSSAPPPSTTTTPPTTTSTPGLPVTGSSLTGILVAGVALIAAGGATLFFMRRRRTAAGE
jgi:LPXTG-motif cell wall-anchored protein